MRPTTKALERFFASVRDAGWFVCVSGAIRCQTGDCPLSKASGHCDPRAAARILGISSRTAFRIANAADSRTAPHRKWLKQKLGMRV